jgi:pSer/pThr/pTyr-binding forkhead associated (FHA) protein
VLSDPNVSRRHAELRQEGQDWVVVDLDSTNGTTVNGEHAKRHVLRDGDRIALGTSELIFKQAEV